MVPVLLLMSVPYILAVNAGTAIDLPTCLVCPPALFRFSSLCPLLVLTIVKVDILEN
jgi:hypothetical protein